MNALSPSQKKEILARISSFNYSGFSGCLTSNVTCYSQSSVGRNFKIWAQMAPFILHPYISTDNLELWIALSDVGTMGIHIHICVCACLLPLNFFIMTFTGALPVLFRYIGEV